MTQICVVTVAAGKNSGLTATVASVDQQTLLPYRHILVVSGVPAEELNKLPHVPYRVVLVDQDKSLYDAMNIGLAKAEGELVVFLNGGDTLYRATTLETVSKKWDGRSILTGRSLQVFEPDMYVRPAVGRIEDLSWSAPHQSFYCPLAKELPRYEDSTRIGADSQWMSQVRKIYPQQYVNDILCRFGLGGLSNTPSLQTVRRHFRSDGFKNAVKEMTKLVLHRSLGRRKAYQILYAKRYGRCDKRPDRAFRFPVELHPLTPVT